MNVIDEPIAVGRIQTRIDDEYLDRAERLFPGVSNGEYGMPRELIPIIDRGKGAYAWGTNGVEYLDMTMAWGASLVGHAHPKVLEAACSQAQSGGNFAAITRTLVELAEQIADISPCVEKIRFVASGTEATMLCLRVARAATGRRKVLKFEGAYHGQHPEGVASLVGQTLPDWPKSDTSGTGAPWVEQDVLVAPYNDLETTERILRESGDQIAGMIVEPLHRCIVPKPGFLEGLRKLCTELGIVLIFDEVVTGWRLALGGAQEYYGVQPDLVAYGKALGGGFPIGAYGGKSSVMEVVNEHKIADADYLWSASTTGGNPVSAAAAKATIDLLSQSGVHDSLHARGRDLRKRLGDGLKSLGVVGQVLGDGPLAQVAFCEHEVTDHRSWKASDRAKGREMMLGLLRRGVFLNPMGTKLYLSIAHDEAAVDRFETSFLESLKAL